MDEVDIQILTNSLMFVTLAFKDAVNGDASDEAAIQATALYVSIVGEDFAVTPKGIEMMGIVFGIATLSGAILARQDRTSVVASLLEISQGLGLNTND